MKKDIAFLVLGGIALLCSMFHVKIAGLDAAWITVLLCGLPIILEAVIGLMTAFDIKADVLVSLALIASLVIGESFAAGEIAFIMQIGALLEDITVAKAQSGIEKLVHLTPRTARKLEGNQETMIPAQEVKAGDILKVLPGETIPADGEIIKGETSVNESVMTGEAIPVDKTAGDEVKSGTMNQYGSFEMKAACDGEDSSMQRMVKLVQSADADKAKIVGIADRWATWIVVVALTAALLTWFLTGEIIRSVTILVVFCPCALILATPTAIMAAIGNLTRHGVLVRQGDALERLAEVSKIAFDKTGTITTGKPQVIAVKSIQEKLQEQDLYTWVYGAELGSEHPLGKAIVHSYEQKFGKNNSKVEKFQMLPGKGVLAEVEGRQIAAGNLKLMESIGAWGEEAQKHAGTEEYLVKGCNLIYVAVNQESAGFLALSDTMRSEAAQTIQTVKSLKVIPVLLSGDKRETAEYIAAEAGIDEVKAECLPQDKIETVQGFMEAGEKVCMVGDGVNDAPALKKAYVGMAMGGMGSDITIESADIVLVRDNIAEIPHTVALSRRMMRTIKWNMMVSMGINTLAILLAIGGMLSPVAGALIHNGGSVLVIINSALLLRWKMQKTERFIPPMGL